MMKGTCEEIKPGAYFLVEPTSFFAGVARYDPRLANQMLSSVLPDTDEGVGQAESDSPLKGELEGWDAAGDEDMAKFDEMIDGLE